MADWTEDDPRHEAYPSAPQDPDERRAWIDKRNLLIGDGGAATAVKNSGQSIGSPKKGKDDK